MHTHGFLARAGGCGARRARRTRARGAQVAVLAPPEGGAAAQPAAVAQRQGLPRLHRVLADDAQPAGGVGQGGGVITQSAGLQHAWCTPCHPPAHRGSTMKQFAEHAPSTILPRCISWRAAARSASVRWSAYSVQSCSSASVWSAGSAPGAAITTRRWWTSPQTPANSMSPSALMKRVQRGQGVPPGRTLCFLSAARSPEAPPCGPRPGSSRRARDSRIDPLVPRGGVARAAARTCDRGWRERTCARFL